MSAAPSLAYVEEPDRVRAALSPIRRRLLDLLREPASATQLAAALAMGRQRVNYHLRALEDARLIDLVEERPRRGCTERILMARAQAFIVDPAVMAASRSGMRAAVSPAAQDRFAAEHLIETAAGVVRDVARMQTQAARQGTRLLTFAIETDVRFATPADFERFTTTIARHIARAAAACTADAAKAEGGGRRYRIVIGGHPAPLASSHASHTSQASHSSHASPQSAGSEQPAGARSHERVRARPHRDHRRRPH